MIYLFLFFYFFQSLISSNSLHINRYWSIHCSAPNNTNTHGYTHMYIYVNTYSRTHKQTHSHTHTQIYQQGLLSLPTGQILKLKSSEDPHQRYVSSLSSPFRILICSVFLSASLFHTLLSHPRLLIIFFFTPVLPHHSPPFSPLLSSPLPSLLLSIIFSLPLIITLYI